MGFAAISSQLWVENLAIAGLATVTALLISLVALNIVEALDVDNSIRRTLVAVIIPLFIVFTGITIYHSLLALQ